MAKINDEDEGSVASEDNEEGMGDVDLGDDLNEERKEEEDEEDDDDDS